MKVDISDSQRQVFRRLADFDLTKWGPFVALIVVSLFATIASPYFLLPRNLLNVSRQVAQNGIVSVGMTFVILTAGIDLSVGSVLAFAGIVCASVAKGSRSLLEGGVTDPGGVRVLYAALVAILVGAAIGLLQGTLIAARRS